MHCRSWRAQHWPQRRRLPNAGSRQSVLCNPQQEPTCALDHRWCLPSRVTGQKSHVAHYKAIRCTQRPARKLARHQRGTEPNVLFEAPAGRTCQKLRVLFAIHKTGAVLQCDLRKVIQSCHVTCEVRCLMQNLLCEWSPFRNKRSNQPATCQTSKECESGRMTSSRAVTCTNLLTCIAQFLATNPPGERLRSLRALERQ